MTVTVMTVTVMTVTVMTVIMKILTVMEVTVMTLHRQSDRVTVMGGLVKLVVVRQQQICQ